MSNFQGFKSFQQQHQPQQPQQPYDQQQQQYQQQHPNPNMNHQPQQPYDHQGYQQQAFGHQNYQQNSYANQAPLQMPIQHQQMNQMPQQAPMQQAPIQQMQQMPPMQQQMPGPPINNNRVRGYQITAQSYAAYPEYDPEFNVKANISYQHGSVARGWNDPPPIVKNEDLDVLRDVKNPEATIVASLSSILQSVKQLSHPSKQRMIDDAERRLETLFDLLASKSLHPSLLASTYTLVSSLEKRDFGNGKLSATDLMTRYQAESKWILGVKRLIELYELCG